MRSINYIEYFEQLRTPFYFYDTGLLHKTLFAIKSAASLFNYNLHYAIKANANDTILKKISKYGLGADCVSANEIQKALNNGFAAESIVFAGVGKTDDEIAYAIEREIFSINCESLQELEVINQIADQKNRKVRVALRINPNVDAKTHEHITTGIIRNKFGISFNDLQYIVSHRNNYQNLVIDGVHFHIGSQITDLAVFEQLCQAVNKILEYLQYHKFCVQHVNLGGGLGIDYSTPENQIPDFRAYFTLFNKNLNLLPSQKVHFEPGRSIVGQSGVLISRVLYVKDNGLQKTLILDSGFTELLRPALYQANHKIVNLSSAKGQMIYDVAGPICETSDYFGKSVMLPETKRGDIIAILSAGAYGEVMASNYNLRAPVAKYFSHEMQKITEDTLLTL